MADNIEGLSPNEKFDFQVVDLGSVWQVRAVSATAKDFATDNFEVEGWQGCATDFYTDWRPALALGERLVREGFRVVWS